MSAKFDTQNGRERRFLTVCRLGPPDFETVQPYEWREAVEGFVVDRVFTPPRVRDVHSWRAMRLGISSDRSSCCIANLRAMHEEVDIVDVRSAWPP
jgi:hypothetical protein